MNNYSIGTVFISIALMMLITNFNIEPLNSIVAVWWPTIFFAVCAALFVRKLEAWSIFFAVVTLMVQLSILFKESEILEMLLWPIIFLGVGAMFIVANRKYTGQPGKSVRAFLGGVEHRYDKEKLDTLEITAIMGGVDLDLRKADIEGEVVVHLNVIMGGAQLMLPDNMKVVSDASFVLGGIENKAPLSDNKHTTTLRITGVVLMGGVEIQR